jgi:hypothetical protein
MNVEIDGEDFDLKDPRMRAEAVRRWLKNKAESKTFNLPDAQEEPRKKRPTPYRPMAALPK